HTPVPYISSVDRVEQAMRDFVKAELHWCGSIRYIYVGTTRSMTSPSRTKNATRRVGHAVLPVSLGLHRD
ncbi:MAG: hypothetical protein M3445_03350, partial [Actinomycetota bacterium]|nr:hypothetical protein [Actinomycetota bacterium]